MARDALTEQSLPRVGLHLDLVGGNVLVDGDQELVGQVAVVVDAPARLDVVLLGHLVLHLGVVQVRGEHHDRIREHVGRVGRSEHPETANKAQ